MLAFGEEVPRVDLPRPKGKVKKASFSQFVADKQLETKPPQKKNTKNSPMQKSKMLERPRVLHAYRDRSIG